MIELAKKCAAENCEYEIDEKGCIDVVTKKQYCCGSCCDIDVVKQGRKYTDETFVQMGHWILGKIVPILYTSTCRRPSLTK